MTRIALLLWRKKFHLLLLSFPSSLDGDVESGLWCCCCQLALCHTHPLPLFHWADSSGRQSRSGVAEYQCRGIMHILQVKEFQNTQGLPAIPWNTKGGEKNYTLSSPCFSSGVCIFAFENHIRHPTNTLNWEVSWVHSDTVPCSPQPASGPVKQWNF